MNGVLISSLLGVAVLIAEAAFSEGVAKVRLSVWPPGSDFFPGESVWLQCAAEANATGTWSYSWFTSAGAANPRHLVSGDSYSITAATREDAGAYWCQAQRRDGNATAPPLRSRRATLRVSGSPPPAPAVTPGTRQFLDGESFAVRCPVSPANSSAWVLRRVSREGREQAVDPCSPSGGASDPGKPAVCVFTASRRSGGLYWCQGAGARSSTVNITVSYGPIILKTPAFAVSEGDTVVLSCQYSAGRAGVTTFFKNGAEIANYTSLRSDAVIKTTIENVTRADEGLYKCSSKNRKMESPEAWLSVRSSTSADLRPPGTAAAWIAAACGVLLLLLVCVSVWLLRRHRYQLFGARSRWRASSGEAPAAELPATKQDVTEVQWDLSWMEMSNLLDKQQYPGT